MSAPVTLKRLEAARLTLAELVLADDRYLPLFERIEAEIKALHVKESGLDRARTLLTDHKATGSNSRRM